MMELKEKRKINKIHKKPFEISKLIKVFYMVTLFFSLKNQKSKL